MSRFRRRFVVLVVGLVLVAVPAAAGAVGGFGGPLFGLDAAPNGDLLVADAGEGVVSVRKGVVVDTIALPGVTDVSALGRNSGWATTSGFDPQSDSGQGIYRISKGTARLVANLFAFEAAANPDGQDPFDSNPFDVEAINGRSALVVDAGGNDLLRVSNQGDVEVLAVFPDELVTTDNIKALAGCPPVGGPDFPCGLPPVMPAQAVPTSVAIGPDGYYYVGELRGFPAPTGASSVWKVAPDASWEQCPSAKCVKVFDGGFTSIIDLAFGPDGKLYVAELDEASWAAVEIFMTPAGGTINACDVDTGTCSEVATGVPILTAIAFKKNGSLWATQNALIPGLAEVVKIS